MNETYKRKSVSIILVNYFTKDYLYVLIKSILRFEQQDNFDIIVVNNSIEEDLNYLYKLYSKIQIIDSNTNVGFGKAVNIGAKSAKGDHLLFLNVDCEFIRPVLKDLLKIMEKKDYNGVFSIALENSNGTPQNSAFSFPTVSELFMEAMLGKWIKVYRDRKYFDNLKKDVNKVDWVSGAFILINKLTFESINGFDERIFMYGEDTELCYRLNKNSINVYFVPTIKIVHHLGKSFKSQLVHLNCADKGRYDYFKITRGHFVAKTVLICFEIRSLLRFVVFSLLGAFSFQKKILEKAWLHKNALKFLIYDLKT